MTERKLCPREPTQEMMQAGDVAWGEADHNDYVAMCGVIYRAMYDAAPAPAALSKPAEPPQDVETAETKLERELSNVLNCNSAESASNTPDWILAQFLEKCLLAWNAATQQRENWYGRDPRPSVDKRTILQGNPVDKSQDLQGEPPQDVAGLIADLSAYAEDDSGHIPLGTRRAMREAAAALAAMQRERDELRGMLQRTNHANARLAATADKRKANIRECKEALINLLSAYRGARKGSPDVDDGVIRAAHAVLNEEKI